MTISATTASPEWLSVRGRTAKKLLDVAASALICVLAHPLIVIIWLVVMATSPGPVIHRQMRLGQNGRPFRMLKFRTMYAGAHATRASLAQHNKAGRHLFKLRDDPRVTPVGRILRRYSLDELPQLVNVLRGEMSMVGPRPLPVEDSDYKGPARDRLLVPPGLTGLWQVYLPWDEMVRLDLAIMARTVAAVLTGRGAH